ncbi:hypothetical protein WDW89_20175 [Deltaproteobacteria bacterium TL4]
MVRRKLEKLLMVAIFVALVVPCAMAESEKESEKVMEKPIGNFYVKGVVATYIGIGKYGDAATYNSANPRALPATDASGQIISGQQEDHVVAINEVYFKPTVKRGNTIGFVSIYANTYNAFGQGGRTDKGDHHDFWIDQITTITKLDKTTLILGKQAPEEGYNFARGAGGIAGETQFGKYGTNTGRAKNVGVSLRYRIVKDIEICGTVFDGDTIGLNTGTSLQLGSMGRIGSTEFRLSLIQGEGKYENYVDNPDIPGDQQKLARSNNHAGIKYHLSERNSFSVDYSSRTLDYDEDGTTSFDVADTAFQVTIGVGQNGSVVITGASVITDDAGAETKDLYSNLLYNYDIEKGLQSQFFYTNQTSTLPTDEDRISRMIGGGIKIFY